MIPLLVDLDQGWRGGQNQLLLLLKGLYERGHAAELLTSKGSSLGHRVAKSGICVHYAPRGKFNLPAASSLRKLMADGRFDLVHVNESHALTAAWLARTHRKVPLLISRRVGYALGKSYFSRARFSATARIIANSRWVAEQIIASGAEKGKVHVIYEGVEIPPVVSAEAHRESRARWSISDGDTLLGCAGVLLEDKGQEWVIRALAPLRKQFPNCKLLLAGEGAYRQSLRALTNALHLQDAVIFAGFVRDIEHFYRAIDVFVFPALFEGLGTSLLAAMAHGVPSVTYLGCALGEIVQDGESGLQVEPRNPEAVAGGIARILTSPELAKKMGVSGRQRIETVFSAERMVDETVKLYSEVIR
jgi:glycosyltransferase involved in cell wall biosynthesis